MANNCYFDMMVSGHPDKVEDFCKVLKGHYMDRFFCRVFSAEEVDREVVDGIERRRICGDCAWSVSSCMLHGPLSYYESAKTRGATNLAIETARLCVQVEVFSEEVGLCFAEHHLYRCGEELADECVDLFCHFFEEVDESTLEDWEELKERGVVPHTERLEDHLGEDFLEGGFGEYEFAGFVPFGSQDATAA